MISGLVCSSIIIPHNLYNTHKNNLIMTSELIVDVSPKQISMAVLEDGSSDGAQRDVETWLLPWEISISAR